MADQGEKIKIPLFSVLKNGIILKNIFLNFPQWESKPSSDLSSREREQDGGSGGGDDPDPVLIGRHPDCHIVLDHPSISRFHLEIRANPASQKLSVMDRSSVHGTWVSGNRIQPNVAVDLTEGDTVKLGASTRVYELHWVPLSCAFEMENPLPALLEENEETQQMENANEIWVDEIPSAPPIPESISLQLESDNPSLSFCSGLATMLEENRTPEKDVHANEAQSICEHGSPLMTSEKKGKSLSILLRRSKSKSVSSLRIQTGRKGERMAERDREVDQVIEEEEALCRVLFENEGEKEEEELFIAANDDASPLSSVREESCTRNKEALLNVSHIFLSPSSPKQTRTVLENCEEEEDEVHASDKENLTPVVPSSHKSRKRFGELQISSAKAMAALSMEEDAFYSDKENLTPVVPSSHKSRKRFGELQISSVKAMTALSMEEDAFYSDKENLTPVVPSSHKSRKRSGQLQISSVKGMTAFSTRADASHSDNENLTPVVPSSHKSRKRFGELQISSAKAIRGLSAEEDAFCSDKENWTPEVKSKNLVHKDFQRFDGQQNEAFSSDKENLTPEFSGSRKSNKLLPRDFLKVDEEAFFSDKENVTPNASGVKKSKRALTDSQTITEREIIERRKARIPFQSLVNNSPSKNESSLKHAQRTADKERTPSESPIEKSPLKSFSPLSKEKVPFPSLAEYSPSRNCSPFNHAQNIQSVQSSPLRSSSPLSIVKGAVDTGNEHSSFIQTQRADEELSNSFSQCMDQVLNEAGGNKKRWIMVIDTGCFLNKESRKALQLLEGLKGTQLIIPRMVIRELDCLKRHESLFRKNRKVASSVLQWIEDCMLRSSQWIHVQKSTETMPIAPTPPVTPRSELGDGSDEMGIGASSSFTAFSTCGSLMEIVSPTAEDHILDCALLFKELKNDGQLVLLTDSVALKIKAMAEGLLCETASEFRESLVNPYSKRFLWSDSIARGLTWSCLDEVGMIDDYCYQLPNVRKTAKATESIRGLKLIMLHNSHYGRISAAN